MIVKQRQERMGIRSCDLLVALFGSLAIWSILLT